MFRPIGRTSIASARGDAPDTRRSALLKGDSSAESSARADGRVGADEAPMNLVTNPVAAPKRKCAKYAKALGVKAIDTAATGSRENNELVKLLVCECGKDRCKDAVARHAACHGAVMGVGAFDGRRDCGAELLALHACGAAAARAEPFGEDARKHYNTS